MGRNDVQWADPNEATVTYTSAEPPRPGLYDLQYGHDQVKTGEAEHQRAAYLEALKGERDGYLQYGRTERADQVADVLAELGETVDKVTPKPKREPSVKRRMVGSPAAEEKTE